MDDNTQAARVFYRLIRKFAETCRPWDLSIRYQTKPDERFDLTLVSRRVYGRPDEYLAVMAAAGLDQMDQPLPQTVLVLPTESHLRDIKRKSGFESLAAQRGSGGRPVWDRS